MAKYRVPVLQDFSWQPPVSDKDLSDPPGAPSKGDRYLVGGSAVNAWEAHENDIAWYDGATWQFDTPSNGWQVYVLDESGLYEYDGAAWALTSAAQASSAAEANSGTILANSTELLTVSAAALANSTEILAVSAATSAAISAAKANSAVLVGKQDIGVYVSEYGALEFEM